MYSQPLPHSLEIEKSILGCLMLGKQDYILKLSEIDFFNPLCRETYQVIKQLFEKKQAIDIVTVSDALNHENSLKAINDMLMLPATPENIEHYLKQLKNYTMRREIIKSSYKSIEMAMENRHETSIDLKNDVMQLFDLNVCEENKVDLSMSSILNRVLEDIENVYNNQDEEKLFTGFYDLDKITAGLHGEELTIIAARPGVGKTAFALQLLVQLALKGNHCLFVSREMSNVQIGKRILSNMAQVDGHKLRFCKALKDGDWERIGKASGVISTMPVEINDRIATVQEIRSYCRELKNKNKINVLIIDYLQLMRSMKKFDSYRLEISDISRQLKEISLEFGIPVIALSQLSRDAVGSNEPELHHLKESGSLEQDADNVIFLHVPKDIDQTQDSFEIKVIVSKQRNGPTGFIWLKYDKRTFKFLNITRG